MDKNIKNKKRASGESNSKLVEKDMEIRKLREEVLKFKVTVNNMNTQKENFLKLTEVREDIVMADRFIRGMLKADFFNYLEEIIMEDSSEVSKKEKRKSSGALERTSEAQLCRCSDCIMKTGLLGNMRGFWDRDKKIERCMNISSSVSFNIKFSPKDWVLKSMMTESKKKVIQLQSRLGNLTDITMKFYKKSRSDDIKDDFNFDSCKVVSVTIAQEEFMVSLSSMIVVQTMREAKTNIIIPNHQLERIPERENIDCFTKMYMAITGLNLGEIYSIEELLIEEEMIFLTRVQDRMLYLKIQEKNNFENHISTEWFEGCISMKGYLLVTTEFRAIRFFASREFTMRDLDNDTRSNSEFSSKDWFPPSSMDFTAFPGKMRRDFLVETTQKIYTNQGFDSNMLSTMYNSRLMPMYFMDNLEKKFKKIEWTYLDGISWREFRAIFYFTGRLSTLVNWVVNDNLSKFKQMVTILPKLVYEYFYSNVDVSDKDLMVESGFLMSNFYEKLDLIPLLECDMLWKVYKFFKFRVSSMVYLTTMAVKFDMDLNGLENSKNVWMPSALTQDATNQTNNFFSLRNLIHKGEMKDVSRWQPSGLTNEAWRHLDMDLSIQAKINDMDRTYDEESEEKTLQAELLERM